jgi:hypothetical protein
MSDEPVEHDLLRQAVCVLEPCVAEAETEHFMENKRGRVTLRADPVSIARRKRRASSDRGVFSEVSEMVDEVALGTGAFRDPPTHLARRVFSSALA